MMKTVLRLRILSARFFASSDHKQVSFLIRIALLVTSMLHNVDVSVGVNDGDCGFSVDQGASLKFLVINFQHLSMLSNCQHSPCSISSSCFSQS